jgi:uncharacterized coiled-coil protein SlyX
MADLLEIKVAVLEERIDNQDKRIRELKDESNDEFKNLRVDFDKRLVDLESKIENTHTKLDEILTKISNVQFGWKIIVVVATVLASSGAVIGEVISHFGLFK